MSKRLLRLILLIVAVVALANVLRAGDQGTLAGMAAAGAVILVVRNWGG